MPAVPKTKLPTTVNSARKRENGTEITDNGEKKRKRVTMKNNGWQKHMESVKGYYFPLYDNWFVFVCLYRNEVRIHLREYFKTPDSTLVPTKTGATLWESDFDTLKKIGPVAHETWLDSNGGILNHPLSKRSDYYLIIGSDENDELKFCIKICFPSGDGESLTSTMNGTILDLAGWNKLMEQINEISESVDKMKKYIVE